MDQNALPMVVYITDSVNCNIVLGIYDGLIMQYSRADVAFNIINLSDGCDAASFQFGYPPDPSGIIMMAQATDGVYMTPYDIQDKTKYLLARKVLIDTETHPELHGSKRSQIDEYCISIPYFILIQCNLREGFRLYNIMDGKVMM